MKTLKRLIKFCLKSLIIGTILVIVSFQYLKTTWKEFISEKELTELISEIKSSEELPNEFYNLYEKEYPNSLKYGYVRILFKNIQSKKRYKSPSSIASLMSNYPFKNTKYSRSLKLNEYILSSKLEEKVSQKECLNWVAKRFNFTYGIIGISNASEFYFQKKTKILTKKEIAGMIVLMKNPHSYNPLRRKEKFEQKVKEVIKE